MQISCLRAVAFTLPFLLLCTMPHKAMNNKGRICVRIYTRMTTYPYAYYLRVVHVCEVRLSLSCTVNTMIRYRVRNCAFLVANATKHFALATRMSQLVANGRLTISCHDNKRNNNFDFQPNRLK